MKTLVLLALLLAAGLAPYANAKIDPDAELLKIGAIDSDYNVINENIFRAYMQYLNADMQDYTHKKGTLSPDPYNRLSFDADGILLKIKYPYKVTKKNKAALLSIMDQAMDKDICRVGLFKSQVLRKRNWNIRIENYDSTNTLLSSRDKKMQDCPEVLNSSK